ncbi:hypothetical protein JCM8097_002247 [Rhodosporidiobolus ruineniae]
MTPRTVLRLLNGRWTAVPSSALNLARHRPPPSPAPSPTQPKRFDTLASETTPVPSIQAVPAPPTSTSAGDGGARQGVAKAGAVELPPAPQEQVKSKAEGRGKETFLGVEVPVKPSPPEEGECCMSGCAHCVYDLYLEDLETYHALLSSTRSAVRSALAAGQPAPPRDEWPELLRGVLDEVEKGGTEGVVQGEKREGDPKREAQRELEATRKELDPTMRAFLEMEARMKAKQASAPPPGP